MSIILANILVGPALDKGIKSMPKQVTNFSSYIHLLAVSALSHCQTGDCKKLTAVYNGMPTAYRKSIVDWSQNFGPVSFNSTKLIFSIVKKGIDWNIAGACEMSPADFAKAKGAAKVTAPKALHVRLGDMIKSANETGGLSAIDEAFVNAFEIHLERFMKGNAALLASTAAVVAPKAEGAEKPAVVETAPKATPPAVATESKADKAARIAAEKAVKAAQAEANKAKAAAMNAVPDIEVVATPVAAIIANAQAEGRKPTARELSEARELAKGQRKPRGAGNGFVANPEGVGATYGSKSALAEVGA